MAAPVTTIPDLTDAAITGVRLTVSHIVDKDEYAHLCMNATEAKVGLADYFQKLVRKAISDDIARSVAARISSGARPGAAAAPAPALKVEPVKKPAAAPAKAKKGLAKKKAAPKSPKKQAAAKAGAKKGPAKRRG